MSHYKCCRGSLYHPSLPQLATGHLVVCQPGLQKCQTEHLQQAVVAGLCLRASGQVVTTNKEVQSAACCGTRAAWVNCLFWPFFLLGFSLSSGPTLGLPTFTPNSPRVASMGGLREGTP